MAIDLNHKPALGGRGTAGWPQRSYIYAPVVSFACPASILFHLLLIMDPEQLSQAEGHDKVPDLPLGPSVAAAYGNAAVHNALHRTTSAPRDTSPIRRTTSRASHVDVGHFDPSGVSDLRRTLSQMTAERKRVSTDRRSEGGKHKSAEYSDATSEITLALGDGPFDFEKTLRNLIKKSVNCPLPMLFVHIECDFF